MDLSAKHILVVGLAQTGVSVANVCARRGARVTVTDARSEEMLARSLLALEGKPTLDLGGHTLRTFEEADLVVVSPGVPDLPGFKAARLAGVPVIAEIELAYRLLHPKATLIAITGTNGKSTTTALTGSLCQASGRPTFCGGNLGNMPMIEVVDHQANCETGFIVVEVAGFMLEHCDSFKPKVAACLNISEDHLDRFKTMERYAAVKNSIYKWQDERDFAIINANDPLVCEGAKSAKAKHLVFDSKTPSTQGACLSNDRQEIVLNLGKIEERYPISDLPIIGNHNLENAMAAYLAARSAGVLPEHISPGAQSFTPQKHRMERVADIGGITYFDDSKGTNVAAVAASLFGFPYSVVLIAGGVHKGGSYEPLLKAFDPLARGMILIGEAAAQIRLEAQDYGVDYPLVDASTMEDAVRKAEQLAKSGDAIVLSPACASYDMFKNFGERGMAFRAALQSAGEPT